MRSRMVAIVGALLLVGLAGCSRQAPAESPASGSASGAAAPPTLHLNRAQPKLPTLKLWLGQAELEAEVARTQAQLATGMMFRTNIAEREAMLFVFGAPTRASFYMRNTTVPLSCAYVDGEGVIREIHELKPLDEKPVEAATDTILYVLETREGWFSRHQVGVGAVITTPYGALRDINWATLRPGRPR